MGRELKEEFNKWCRLKGTTLVMSLFAAYVALVFCWCNTFEAVFLYQIDGRFGQIQDTIGYISFPLYLRIRMLDTDSFTDLLNRITDEYCGAYEHADFCYMEAQEHVPEFARNTLFNWVGRSSEREIVDLGRDSIEVSPILFERRIVDSPDIDVEPGVSISETDHEIRGRVYFPLRRFSFNTMERFVRNIPAFAMELVRQPNRRVKDLLSAHACRPPADNTIVPWC